VAVERKGGRETLVVRELPYQVNKARLIERIAELVKDKKLEGISEFRDESDREGLRVVIQLKKDEPAQTILNQLYLHTQMQVTFGINLVAIVENRPELLNLKDLLRHFLAHRREVILRRTRYELKQAEARAHILAGLLIALDHLDEVIDLIRAAPDAATAKEQLISRFALDDIQAQAILDMRLARLTGLERQKIIDEAKELEATIARLRLILAEEAQVKALIAENSGRSKKSSGTAAKPRLSPRPRNSPTRT
jgi:DNA gyrase subunit A